MGIGIVGFVSASLSAFTAPEEREEDSLLDRPVTCAGSQPLNAKGSLSTRERLLPYYRDIMIFSRYYCDIIAILLRYYCDILLRYYCSDWSY